MQWSNTYPLACHHNNPLNLTPQLSFITSLFPQSLFLLSLSRIHTHNTTQHVQTFTHGGPISNPGPSPGPDTLPLRGVPPKAPRPGPQLCPPRRHPHPSRNRLRLSPPRGPHPHRRHSRPHLFHASHHRLKPRLGPSHHHLVRRHRGLLLRLWIRGFPRRRLVLDVPLLQRPPPTRFRPGRLCPQPHIRHRQPRQRLRQRIRWLFAEQGQGCSARRLNHPPDVTL